MPGVVLLPPDVMPTLVVASATAFGLSVGKVFASVVIISVLASIAEFLSGF